MKTAELFNPATESWDTLAPAQHSRHYHSVGILLPDARVLVGGNTRPYNPGNPIDDRTIELFSPPYLFRGPQPVITWVPERVGHDERILICFSGCSVSGQGRRQGESQLDHLGGFGTVEFRDPLQQYGSAVCGIPYYWAGLIVVDRQVASRWDGGSARLLHGVHPEPEWSAVEGETSSYRLSLEHSRSTIMPPSRRLDPEPQLPPLAGGRQRLTSGTQNVRGLRLLDDNFYGVPQAIAVPLDRRDRLRLVNAALDELRANGFLGDSVARSGVEGLTVAPLDTPSR